MKNQCRHHLPQKPAPPVAHADISAKLCRHLHKNQPGHAEHLVGRSRHGVSGNGAAYGHVYGSPLREDKLYYKIHFEKYNKIQCFTFHHKIMNNMNHILYCLNHHHRHDVFIFHGLTYYYTDCMMYVWLQNKSQKNYHGRRNNTGCREHSKSTHFSPIPLV